jgi:hypothetical protein
MNTDDLISALARDAALTEPPMGRRLALAFAASAFVAFALLMLLIKPRPDLAIAATTILFDLKMLLIGLLAVAAIAMLRQIARPEGQLPRAVLILPVALLVFGLGHELATQPPALYGARLVGQNWAFCLVAIPLMAVGPLALIMTAMRSSAPADARLAGAIAGFAAGIVAALFYGIHCIDDSPLFVVTWYTIAVGLMTLLGGAIGRRVLAW